MSIEGYWSIATVMAGQEYKFRDRIIDHQCELGAYVPSKRSQYSSRRHRKPVTHVTPAFPRYVFIHSFTPRCDAWLDRTHIDYRLMSIDGITVRLKTSEMDRVRAMEAAGQLDNLPPNKAAALFAGLVVTYTQGVMEGVALTVMSQPNLRDKWVWLFGAGKTFKGPLDFLQPLS